MSFVLSELVVESVIREGLDALRRDATIVPDIFSDLKQPWLAKKYGDRELAKIQEFFNQTKQQISIVHAWSLVQSSVPCISIQLLDNPEDEGKAQLSDFEGTVVKPITDPLKLASLVKVASLQPTDYDPNTGIIDVPDSVDLTAAHRGMNLVDTSGNAFTILGVSDQLGHKSIRIQGGLQLMDDLDFTGTVQVRSSVNYTVNEVQGNVDVEKLILGVHTKEPLLTKYLYTALKHVIVSRKPDLIVRGFQLPTYSGSDFTRNLEYPGDTVFNRFCTLTGRVQNSWISSPVTPIETFDVQVTVDRAQGSTAQLGLTNQTVQVQDDS